jgi:hypothetical protein
MKNLEFYEAYWFLQDHPALLGQRNAGVDLIDMVVTKVCEHGYTGDEPDFEVTAYEGDSDYESLLAAGYEEEDFLGVKSIDLLYSERYGKPWKFAKTSVWFELGYSRYYKDKDGWASESVHDVDLDVDGDTYEEALIELAGKVKDRYGDWSCTPGNDNCIIPEWIVKNNEKEKYFIGDGVFEMNPNHIRLYNAELNELWWSVSGTKGSSDSDVLSIDHILDEDLEKCLDSERYGKDLVYLA